LKVGQKVDYWVSRTAERSETKMAARKVSLKVWKRVGSKDEKKSEYLVEMKVVRKACQSGGCLVDLTDMMSVDCWDGLMVAKSAFPSVGNLEIE